MAIAERWLGATFNRPDAANIVDHYTYVLASDGDLMEAVAAEAVDRTVLSQRNAVVGRDVGHMDSAFEQLASLRALPNMMVLRPSDTTETVEAQHMAMMHTGGPGGLVLTRQKSP
jgi:transketolase